MSEKDENNGNENNDSAADEALDRAELIEKTGEVTSQNAKHLIHCLTITRQPNMNTSCLRLWLLSRTGQLRVWS